MPFDLENLNPGTWFPYPLPREDAPKRKKGAPEEKVCFRVPDGEFLRSLDDETVETRREFVQPRKKSGKINMRAPMQHVEFPVIKDQDLRNERLWDYMITDWQLYDKKGQLIPCVKENKTTLMRKSSEFALYSADCLERVRENEGEQKTAEGKNS